MDNATIGWMHFDTTFAFQHAIAMPHWEWDEWGS